MKFPPINGKRQSSVSDKTERDLFKEVKKRLRIARMGDAVKLDEIMRMRNAMKMKLTPRFRKWWDSQIERCKDEQGTSRKKKDSNQDATLAEAIGTGRKEVSVPWFSLVLVVNACMY